MRMNFDSDEDTGHFYNMYSGCVSFSLRRGDRKIDKKSGIIICHNFLFKYDCKSKKFVVTEFVREQNYLLSSHEHVPFLRSHKKVSKGDLVQARTLQGVSVGTSQIMKVFVLQEGCYDTGRSIKKDLYNRIDAERREDIVDGDTESGTSFLSAKQDVDPMFCFTYDLDEERKLRHLFWCDGQCRVDYDQFGDVLDFDTTYRTNR
ncbi:hypothetical protein M9H77_30034 [Catharanthus roseus]|uniref:Uncharacterized protein n=1 Tax=Catharanthus roseus TaxID=4058 RepID=A0ACB9ZYQ0_CATRO|nr:hypothetical protein M9H77_30034 [Catharanthus roseus]